MTSFPIARIQLQILDDISGNAMLFEGQLFPPRIGEELTVYDTDTDGEEIISGCVINVKWAYSNEEDGSATCTVIVREEETT
jgi:hypothetical protein